MMLFTVGARAIEKSFAGVTAVMIESWRSVGEGNLTNANPCWEVDPVAINDCRRRCCFFFLAFRSSVIAAVLLKTTLLLLGREDRCWFWLGRWRLHCCHYMEVTTPYCCYWGVVQLETRMMPMEIWCCWMNRHSSCSFLSSLVLVILFS